MQRLIQVMQESWNHLILLDACRYDAFARSWNRFFPAGRLECAESVGSATVEWRDRSFPNQYPDVVYVSSNPYINSRKPAMGFFAPDHFHAIVDVWATDWDSNAGTVYPDKVTRAALEALRAYPDKRLLIHYIQPHAPYISQAGVFPGFPVPNVDKGNILVGIPDMSAETPRQRKWFRRFLPIVDAILPEPASWYLAQWLGMPPRSPMDAIRRRLGRRGLRQAYQANLELVLKEVVRLVDLLHGRIVITSDHGERLGEWGSYSHRPGSSSRYLRQIPWLVIDRPHKPHPAVHPPAEPLNPHSPESLSPEEQARIEERLRALGYVE